MRTQLKAFRKKFGRDPRPDEPVFFDPNAPGDVPIPLTEESVRADVLQAMTAVGIAPEIAYAYAKTGLLIVAGFEENFSAEDRAEWQAAIAEYRRQQSGTKN
jgi:hypothetical protein